MVLLRSGAAGLVGAIVLLCADFLLFAHWGTLPAVAPPLESFLAARKSILLASPRQLLLSNLLCPLAALLYATGGWHIYVRLRPASRGWAATAAALFALLASMSCAYHALWSQFGLTLQFANANMPAAAELFERASDHMRRTLDATAIFGLPLIMILSILVLRGRTDYPRWMALANPFLLYALLTPLLKPVADRLPVPYGAVMLSSLSEVAMAAFFALSLATRSRRLVSRD